MASSHPDQQKYERALQRYFQVPPSERHSREREKILKILGLPNPQEFLGMHIPLWEAKVDEMLDPTNTDMVPITISHFYVNWVRGAIGMMPTGSRVKILSAKLKATGLKKAVLTLLHAQSGEGYRDFEVTDVELVQKIHKDTLFTVRTKALPRPGSCATAPGGWKAPPGKTPSGTASGRRSDTATTSPRRRRKS
jgi:hypothetical protein